MRPDDAPAAWMSAAHCTENPGAWDLSQTVGRGHRLANRQQRAARLCSPCSVIVECRAFAAAYGWQSVVIAGWSAPQDRAEYPPWAEDTGQQRQAG